MTLPLNRGLLVFAALVVAFLTSASARAAGVAQAVPYPFLPVAVAQSESGVRVSVWGREIVFGHGPLPHQIRSQGVDLFAHPPVFLLVAQGADAPIAWSPVEVRSQSPRAVTLACVGLATNLRLRAITTIEYDGMIRTTLQVSARSAAEISLFGYELALHAAVASYFTQHVAYDYRQLRIDLRQLAASAGRVGPAEARYAFAPSFSLSNRHVGIEWWAERDSGLAPKPIRVIPMGRTVRWAFEPITSRMALAAGETWAHEFALFPLPLRPPPSDWRRIRFTGPGEAKMIGTRAGIRNVWIAFPLQFSARWHGLPVSLGDPRQARLRADLERDGVGYIPYGKLAAVPSFHPVAMARAEEWAASSERWTGPPGEEAEHMQKQGWKRGQPYGYGPCLGNDGYLDWLLKENLEAFEAERPAGLYFDFGSILSPCVRGDGERSRMLPRWNYFAVRSFYQRLYERVKRENPDALITIHSNGQPKALAGFVDFVFVGEALNVKFRGGRSFAEMRARPEIYVPDYYALPLGFLDALIYPQSGGITALLPEVHHARDPREPGRLKPFTRSLLSLALANDYPLWWVNADLETLVSVAKALDRFPGTTTARFVHWRDRAPDPGPCRLRVSSHVGVSKSLLIVSNPDDVNCTRGVRLAEGRRAPVSIRDLESLRSIEIASGRMRISVPAHDFRLIEATFPTPP